MFDFQKKKKLHELNNLPAHIIRNENTYSIITLINNGQFSFLHLPSGRSGLKHLEIGGRFANTDHIFKKTPQRKESPQKENELTDKSPNFHVSHLIDSNKIVLGLGDVVHVIFAELHDGIVREGHLVIISYGRILFVRRFQLAFTYVVHFVDLNGSSFI